MNIRKAIVRLRTCIQELRVDRYPEQKEFANKINMEPSYYSKLEKYGTDIKLSMFLTVCRKLRIQPWVLMKYALEHYFDFTEPESKEWGE